MKQTSFRLGCSWPLKVFSTLSASLQRIDLPFLALATLLAVLGQIPRAAFESHASFEEQAKGDQVASTLSGRLKSLKPPPEAAHLESVLYQLTKAKDIEAFAQQRVIDLVEGRVRVVIELREGQELGDDSDLVRESRYRNLLRVLIPIDELLPVSQQENVKFIRLPHRPVTDVGESSSD